MPELEEQQKKNSKLYQRTAIVRESAVRRRILRRNSLSNITSNGTIAAATMVLAALSALVLANSPAYEVVHGLFAQKIGFVLGPVSVIMPFEQLVNDFFMSIFFLLVGIELKYEMTIGELRRPRQAALPMLAAVGGVCVPALIFLLVNWQAPLLFANDFFGAEFASQLSRGWAIPIATDIAFALGIISLLGNRIKPATKVFFSTLAIADDILAIVVIALFYGHSPDIAWLAATAIMVVVLWILQRLRVYSVRPYLAVGALLWICMFNSGIHATLAGVVLALFLPARSDIHLGSLRSWLDERAQELAANYDSEAHVLGQHDFTHAASRVEAVMHHVTPPLQRVEHRISVLVNFIILPLFAFVNAQIRLVDFDLMQLAVHPLTLGVFFGALVGKPIGIVATTQLLVRLGFSKLPKGVSWNQILAVGLMGGMGFTMSILISDLAFSSHEFVLAAKCAVLCASVAAAVISICFCTLFMRKHKAPNSGI